MTGPTGVLGEAEPLIGSPPAAGGAGTSGAPGGGAGTSGAPGGGGSATDSRSTSRVDAAPEEPTGPTPSGSSHGIWN